MDGQTSASEASLENTFFPAIDLNNLDAVTNAYLGNPVSGEDVWYYTWNSISDIKADDFIQMCAASNYLNLPRDFEGGYMSEKNPSANQVESAIQIF